MASLQRKGTYWQACFRDRNGKQCQRSTRVKAEGASRSETDSLKRKAIVVANKFEMAACGEVGNQAHFRKVLEDLVELSGGSVGETLGSWSSGWLERGEAHYNKSTYGCCKGIVEVLLEMIGRDTALESIKPEQIQAYLDKRAKVRAPATVIKEKKLLGKCFADAVRAGVLAKNPAASTVAPKLTSTERVPFTDDEVAAMIRVADDEWKRVIRVAVMTGLRLRDACSIGSQHYNAQIDAIQIIESKTKKLLTIPTNETLRSMLKLEQVAPYLHGLSNGGINKRFLKIMDAAEIDRVPVGGLKNTTYRKSFHSLRHTFVSKLANAGIDPEIRRKLAGHASVEVHEIYTHHNIERLREAMAKI